MKHQSRTLAKPTRAAKGAAGGALALGLLYLVAVFLMLAGGVDVYCEGLVGSSYTCAAQGAPSNGACLHGVCAGSCGRHGTLPLDSCWTTNDLLDNK